MRVNFFTETRFSYFHPIQYFQRTNHTLHKWYTSLKSPFNKILSILAFSILFIQKYLNDLWRYYLNYRRIKRVSMTSIMDQISCSNSCSKFNFFSKTKFLKIIPSNFHPIQYFQIHSYITIFKDSFQSKFNITQLL